MPLKEERGGRIFPVSDKAIDIVNAFEKILHRLAVQIKLNESVKFLKVDNNKVTGVITEEDKLYEADAVILATGGSSFPGTAQQAMVIAWQNRLGILLKIYFQHLYL